MQLSHYRVKLAQVVTEYVKQIGLLPIAQRYAYNLANGRFCGAIASAPSKSKCRCANCVTANLCITGHSMLRR